MALFKLKTFSTFIKAMFTEFGPNGSGKSTTLGIVLNVVNKTW
jgi:ABC-type Mn2+/Zn2+ transport system ATPase subunit